MELVIIVVGVIIFAIVIRLIAGSFDGDRVEQYIREIGGELIDRSWDPFGPGWFGEKESRIYEIVYRDRDGRTHRAHVKTSMMSGVYLTNDRIVEDTPPRSAEEENEQLRRRLAELERLSTKGEPSATPNGGPATPLGNSGVTEGRHR
jgi:hypothetical protein